MKRLFITTVSLLLCTAASFAQTYKIYQTQNVHTALKLNTCTGEVTQVQDDGQSWTFVEELEPYNKYTNRFRLIKTENIWTYIELDTFTGRLWQVQFSVKDTEHMWFVPINLVVLPDSSETSSTYSVSPMTSIYQFYMVNNDTGAMYKFQWSQKGEDYRWIEPL